MMKQFTDMTGIILAGGKNSRMGKPKAFLEINGQRLIDKTLALYREIFSETIIVTNDPLAYTEFSDAFIVTDIYKGKGALGGIYTGLFYATHQYSFVSACDMPYLNKDFIIYLTNQCEQHDIIVPALTDSTSAETDSKTSVKNGKADQKNKKCFSATILHYQPLHAIYSKNCLVPMKRLINADKLKVTGFYKELPLLQISEEKIRQFDQEGRLFLNLNTPEDLMAQQDQ